MPANAGLGRVIAFQNWPSIDITFLVATGLAKKLIDLIKLACDQLVIVITPGIARDSPSLCSRRDRACCAESCRGDRRRVGRASLEIIQPQNNDRTRAR